MNILHVVAGMDPRTGGVCQAVHTIIKGISSLGAYGNEVVCLDSPDDDHVKNSPVTTHGLGESKGPWAYNSKLIRWLIDHLPRFDFVIIHGLWLYPNHAVRKALKSLSPATAPHCLVMPHGMLDPYFQKDSTRRLKAIRNRIYWKFIESKVINEAAGLLFTCEEEMLLARQTFRPYTPKNEHVVGLGVDHPPTFKPEMLVDFRKLLPDLSTRNYLLFLSRIHPKKGVDLLIRSYLELAKTAPGHKPFPALVIAGPLDSPYAAEMQTLAKTLTAKTESHAAPLILFPGMLRGDLKWGAFYGCDAFVLPSHQENFGIAVVEALACGKPVLISNKINIYREIQAADAGIIAEDDEPGTLKILDKYLNRSNEQKLEAIKKATMCYREKFEITAASRPMDELLQNFNKLSYATQ